MTAVPRTGPALPAATDAPAWAQRWTERWWVAWPLAARRLSAAAAAAAADGYYLATVPRLGALAPPAALLLGLYVGWKQPLFNVLFTESLLLVAFIAVLGTLSANLGLLFTLGYAVGDFLLLRESWVFCCPGVDGLFAEGLLAHVLRERVPLLIVYTLLLFVAVLVPLGVKGLVSELRLRGDAPQRYQLAVGFVGHLVLSVVFVLLWSKVVPVAIRPLFTWPSGSTPTVEAMFVVQARMALPLWLVAFASLGRMYAQTRTALRPEIALRLDVLDLSFLAAEPVLPWWQRLPLGVHLAAKAVVAAVLLAGLYVNWVDALLIAAAVLTLSLLRHRVVPLPLEGWARLTDRIPLVFRFALGLGLVYLLAQVVVARMYESGTTDTFRPIVFSVVGAMVVFWLLSPLAPDARTDAAATDAPDSGPPTPPAGEGVGDPTPPPPPDTTGSPPPGGGQAPEGRS